ncbi:hypothetical protein C2G38_2183821 [Gigaspora rosea]|uniref:Uncharacterized protein n=1 Tax=Gigaspora rosea TaxID=44941 RepID=A0A397V859_9GLOM|nr:hypothetical protein C2G38_2183821 [Gigaspora rosea]
MPITGLCAITTCKKESSTRWKRVTKHVINKGQANNTLPSYLQIEILIDLLYNRENKEERQTIYSFDEFQSTIVRKDKDIAMFIDSSGSSNACIDTFADLGITTTSHTIQTSTRYYYYNNYCTSGDDLMNPITTQRVIPKLNIHNPLLADDELIKANIESRFMRFYGLSHNRRWGFHTEYSIDAAAHSGVVYDYCCRRLAWADSSANGNFTLGIGVSSVSAIFSAMYQDIFGERKSLSQILKPWHINLLLEISRSAWQMIAADIESKFSPLYKDVEYLALKDLLDNMIPLVLDDNGFMENFSHTSTWAAYDKSPLILTLQAITNSSSTKKQKVENTTVPLPVMHMPEAQFCHLPLGFNTSYTPNPFHYCDASNCSISLFINTDSVVLSCGHVEVTPCDDNDEFEKIKYKAIELEEALRKFQQQ